MPCLCSRATSALLGLKNELYVNRIPHGRPICSHTRTEAQRQQNFAKAPVVSAVARRIEAEEDRAAFLVNVEIGREVVAAQ